MGSWDCPGLHLADGRLTLPWDNFRIARVTRERSRRGCDRERSSALTRNVDTTQKATDVSRESNDDGGQEFQRQVVTWKRRS